LFGVLTIFDDVPHTWEDMGRIRICIDIENVKKPLTLKQTSCPRAAVQNTKRQELLHLLGGGSISQTSVGVGFCPPMSPRFEMPGSRIEATLAKAGSAR
jgi:hypothetical protein